MPMGLREGDSTIDDRFLRFFAIVQEAAKAQGAVFFLFCGEGHDLVTDEIDCQDLSGWLIPERETAAFEPIWRDRNWKSMTSEQGDRMVTAIWSGTCADNVAVRFDPMP